MMTVAEVKSILRITDSTYDSEIAFLLPLVERDIIEYCNNGFQDGYVYRESAGGFEFVRGDSDTRDYITDDDEHFLDRGFADGMDIVVEGGYSNIGLYTIDSASGSKLKMTGYGDFVNQDQDGSDDNTVGTIRISRVKWPEAIKLPAAKMIWSLIDDAKPSDVKSEKLDDYSVTYIGGSEYPTKVIRMLDKFRRPKFA